MHKFDSLMEAVIPVCAWKASPSLTYCSFTSSPIPVLDGNSVALERAPVFAASHFECSALASRKQAFVYLSLVNQLNNITRGVDKASALLHSFVFIRNT